MYNQVHQEQIAAGETTLNIVKIPVVQEQVIVQVHRSLIQLLSWKMLPHRSLRQYIRRLFFRKFLRFRLWSGYRNQLLSPSKCFRMNVYNKQFTAEQCVYMPIPQTQEQSAVTDAVEVVDSDLQYELHVDQQRPSR